MFRFILSLLILSAFAVPCLAGDYVLVNGHYAKDGVLYDRIDKSYWGYYYGKWYYYEKYEYVPVKLNFDAYDFDKQLLKAKEVQLRYRYNLELFEKSGLAEPYRPFFGSVPSPVGYYGYAGNTQYGYSYQSVTDVYGQSDINAGMQQSAALARASLDLGDSTNARFNENLKTLTTGMNAAMEIREKAAALAALAAAIRPEPRSSNVTKIDGLVVPPDVAVNGEAALRKDTLTACVECHNQRDPKPAFDLSKYDTLSVEQRMEVLNRVTSKDVTRQMPPPGKGARLTEARVVSLVLKK